MSGFLIAAIAIIVPSAAVFLITELDARFNKSFMDDMENPWKKR